MRIKTRWVRGCEQIRHEGFRWVWYWFGPALVWDVWYTLGDCHWYWLTIGG